MKAKFKGNPLIEIPKNIPSYNFLEGDFGKEILKEYNSIIKQDYKNNSNLKVLNFSEDIVKGSSSYSIFPMNKILEKQGLRTVTPLDAQRIIDKDDNFLRNIYVDLGLVLKTEQGANEYFAKQLVKQAKERNYKFSNSSPLVFKSSDLELIVDSYSPCGLGFKIRESATPFNASELSHENDYERFKITNENGVPIFDKNGTRTNYTKDNGLSKFDLGRDLDLYSKDVNLVFSSSSGRIVVLQDIKKAA